MQADMRTHTGTRSLLRLLFTSAACTTLFAAAAAQPTSCAAAEPIPWVRRRHVDDVKVALLPLGAVEQHGPHLPLGVDLLLAEAVAAGAAAAAADHAVAVLPVSPFGASFEHAHAPGTLAAPDGPLQALWAAVVQGVAEAGVRRVVLLNGHGGQTPNAQIAVRRARFETRPPVLAVLVNLQAVIHARLRDHAAELAVMDPEEAEWEAAHGIHGGLVETALMLHLHPELVDMSAAKRFEPFPSARTGSLEPYGGAVSYGWRASDVFPDGVGGFACRATPELGAAIFDEAVAAVAKVLQDIRDCDPDSVLRAG